jgi:hypothetical protein
MSDEQRKDDEIEVEGHATRVGSTRVGVDEEPTEEGETEVEAHVHRVANVRMDSPSEI